MSELTFKQEQFAQAIVDGHNQTDAYRLAYDVGDSLPATVHECACRLSQNPKIAARIEALRGEAQEAKAVALGWTAERFTAEALANLQGARAADAWAPANGALQLIGKATGLLRDGVGIGAPESVTQIVVVLNHREAQPDAIEGSGRIVEAEAGAEAEY